MINFEPNSSSEKELDALIKNAEKIISTLMDIIEEMAPAFYSQSNEIMCAGDWIKWLNEELIDNEIPEKDLDALIEHAEKIISTLMNIIEESNPEFYYKSNEIMCANDWLKWLNGESMDNEIPKIVEEIDAYCKK